MAISRYERGDTAVISVATAEKLLAYFHSRHLYFGAKDAVCYGSNLFAQERWVLLACYQLLKEHGLQLSSGDLLDAAARWLAPKPPENASH